MFEVTRYGNVGSANNRRLQVSFKIEKCSRSAAAKRSAALTQNRNPFRRISDAVYVNRGDLAGRPKLPEYV